MDMFQKLGLIVISWDKEVKLFNEDEEHHKVIKQYMSKDHETMLFLELKPLNELSYENFYKLFYFLNNNTENFLRIKNVLIKEEKIFYCYQKLGLSMMEYMSSNIISMKKRLLIYKQVIETICFLIYYLKDEFKEFNKNFFYIEEKENLLNEKIPILKFIYHASFNNKEFKFDYWISVNFYFWLFYLHVIIFKDYSTDSENFFYIGGIFEKDLQIFFETLSEIIHRQENTNFTIDAIINYYNNILKKANIEEIQNKYISFKPENNFFTFSQPGESFSKLNSYNNSNIYGLNSNINAAQFSNINNPYPLNLNINNNMQNNQINYNQYFQFYNNNKESNGHINFSQSSFTNQDIIKNKNNNINFLNTPENKYNYEFPNYDTSGVMNVIMNYGNFNLNNPSLICFEGYNNMHENNLNNNLQTNLQKILQNNLLKNSGVFNTNLYDGYFDINNSITQKIKPSNYLLNYNINANNFYKPENIYQKINPTENNSKNLQLNGKFFDDMFNDKLSRNNNVSSSIIKNNVKTKYNPLDISKNSNEIKCVLNSNVKVAFKNESKNNPNIYIIINRNILNENKSFASSYSNESQSVFSEENREFLIKKRNRNTEVSNIKNCLSDESTANKKPRIKKTKIKNNINDMSLCNSETPSKITLSNIYDEKDLEMISKIDNPRRRRVKCNKETKNNFFFSEKSPLFKSEIAKFFPMFDQELENILKNKCHIFMKNNFPQMYNLQNFFLYIKLNSEKKLARTGTIEIEKLDSIKYDTISRLEENEKNPENNKEISFCKKIWDCSKININIGKLFNYNLVDEYLFTIEKIWPLDKYVWCQETALKFLSHNGYDIETSITKITEKSDDFLLYLRENKLEKDEYKKALENINIDSGKYSKRLQYK